MIDFAPVLIPTLNRHNHFKNCIESLAACANADKTELFIALDYPLKDSHHQGYEIIKNYIPNINGFKSVTVIQRKSNYGAIDNTFKSIAYLFERYERIIFTEDDNVFAPDFLSFVNNGLNAYEDRQDIFAITGYQFPVKMPPYYLKDIYLYQGFSAWGFGTWKDKWENVSWSIEDVKLFLKNRQQLKIFNNKSLVSRLKHLAKTRSIAADVFICYYQYINDMYSVFPTLSRVKNAGHDGSGIHGGNRQKVREIYLNQQISDGSKEAVFPLDLAPDFELILFLKKHFTPSLLKIIKNNPHLILPKIAKFLRLK